MNARIHTTMAIVFEGSASATAGELRLYRACAALNALLFPVLLAAGWPLMAFLCAIAAVYGYAWLALAQRYPLAVAWRFSCPTWRLVRLVVYGNTGGFRPVYRLPF